MSAGRSWAIVGGGLLGLTLARRLSQAGHRVTVYEAAPALGGLASAWSLDGVVWDRHYHVVLRSDAFTRGLLSELGLEDELRWVSTRTGFSGGGRWAPLGNAVDYLRLPVLSLVDKVRLAATILLAGRIRDWRRLERTPLEEWLVRTSGRRAFERLWRPLLRAKLGESWRESSAAFLWATIRRLHGARGSGVGKEQLGWIPGGYARVLERFESALRESGVTLRVGTPVASIERAGGGVVVRTDAGEETFERAVVTLTPSRAAAICTSLPEPARQRMRDVRYQGIVCASLLLERPLAGYYLTYLTDALPFTSVIEMSALVDPEQFGGRSLVYLPRYEASDGSFFELSDADVEKTFLDGLEQILPDFRRSDVTCFRVSRVREVFPVPTLRYSETVPPRTTSVPGLHLVSSAHIVNGTLNVNETVQLAERSADALIRSDGLDPGGEVA
ncbi:MAG: FAD-dependent oxidoreductase [Myxococcota bacterium]